jgi:hypothetical protein
MASFGRKRDYSSIQSHGLSKNDGDVDADAVDAYPSSKQPKIPKKKDAQKKKKHTTARFHECTSPLDFCPSFNELMRQLLCEGKDASVNESDLVAIEPRHVQTFFAEKLPKPVKSKMHLVITSSAVRACDIIKRFVPHIDPKRKCAKLFSKHMKIEDQVQFLKTQDCHFGVGTPSRIMQLFANGALSVSSIASIIIDVKPDPKSFSVLTQLDTQKDFFSCFHNYIASSLESLPIHVWCESGDASEE